MDTKEQAREVMECSFAKIFMDSKYSDLVIKCGDVEFRVHRAIVCSQVEPFDKAIEDSKAGVIGCHDDDPKVLRALLQFLYQCDYDVPKQDETVKDPRAEMLFHVHVYAMADKYDVLPLKGCAKVKFSILARTRWKGTGFLIVAKAVYTTTRHEDRGLRDAVTETVCKNGEQLLREEGGHEMFQDTPGLGADVYKFERQTQKKKTFTFSVPWDRMEKNAMCWKCKKEWRWAVLENKGEKGLYCPYCSLQSPVEDYSIMRL